MNNAIQSFLHDHLIVDKGFSQNTLEAYRNDLGQFYAFLEQRTEVQIKDDSFWSKVDLVILNQYITDLREKRGYRDTTTARKIAAIKSFFGYLMAEGHISDDPTESLGSPRIGRSLPKFLTEDDVTSLLDVAGKAGTPESKRDATILELLYATGLRVSELVSLDISDIDFEESFILCRSGKAEKQRRVFLYPKAVEELKQYLQIARITLLGSNKTQIALFVNHRGERLTRQWIWNILKICSKKANIDEGITPHTLRHSFATHMLQNGASLRHVQELLGHSSISTTQVYTHMTNQHMRQEYEKSHPRA
ncbi:MAG: site-specific tyrosine recombinase/integron integrase [Chloroflexota bacterium]|nr:site-specific tyrosine recombinase/integron integrase [Chloroflexota bacterium]